jgi:hypothetical protein
VNAYDTNSTSVSAEVYIDDEYMGTTGSSFGVLPGTHTVRVDTGSHMFHNFAGYAEFQNPIQVQVTSDKTVTANYYANPPPQYQLTISASQGGTTDPTSGDHLYTPQLVTVTAEPDSGYVFDYWLLDTVPYYVSCYEEPSITVPMSSNHTLQACFTPEPSHQWVSSIYGYGDFYYSYPPETSFWLADNPEKLVGWRNDSEFTYLTGLGPTEYYGWINATMNTEAAGHIYLYGYAYNGEGNIYVYVSSDGEEWDLVGCEEVTQYSPYWIDFGLYLSPFNYILLTTESRGLGARGTAPILQPHHLIQQRRLHEPAGWHVPGHPGGNACRRNRQREQRLLP